MQDKFTRQAANALKLAKTTAQSCNHSYIGTEHILVGLLKEKEGTAGRILEEFNVEEDAAVPADRRTDRTVRGAGCGKGTGIQPKSDESA